MKKSYLWTGLGMLALGLCVLAAAIFWDTPLDSLLWGFSGAFFGPGIVSLCRYVKWTKLETEDSWRRHVEEEQIELRDERKEMLRNKSGRIAYVFGLLLGAFFITAFSVLGKLGIVEDAASRLLILFLAGYMLVQLFAGILIYKLLEAKY